MTLSSPHRHSRLLALLRWRGQLRFEGTALTRDMAAKAPRE